MRNYICTITPNPALDLGGTVDRIIPNEKSYVYDEKRYPGGNGINVARILTRLRTPTLATGFLGGAIGEEIESLLNKERVKNKFVKIGGQSRISITISNRTDHRQTRLSFVGPHIRREEKEKLFKFVQNSLGLSLLVIGGSMPPGFSGGDIARLINVARARGIEAVIDCPGHILKGLISAKPVLIKPNLTEFQELTGKNVKSIGSVLNEAKKLLKNVPFVCISSVEKGALFVTRSYSYFGTIPKIKLRSTVGAGDSMVAAMAAQIFRKNTEPRDILKWGLAASAATLMKSGTALGDRSDIFRLYKRIKISQVD